MGFQIRYNPTWISQAGLGEITAAIARITLACGLKHHLRRGDRNPEVWQVASQMVTADIIKNAGFEIPRGIETRNESVEVVYDEIATPDSQDDPNSGEGNAQPKSEGGSNADSDGNADGNADDDNANGEDGGGSDNGGSNANDAPTASTDPYGIGEVLDAPKNAPNGDNGDDGNNPIPQQSYDDLEREMDEALHNAQQAAKGEGNMPAAIQKLIDAGHDKHEDWKTLLREYMNSVTREDYMLEPTQPPLHRRRLILAFAT